MHPRLEKIKTHVTDNKVTYIVGASCLAAGAAIATIVVLKRTPTEASVTTDSFKVLDFKWKSPTTNTITVTLEPRGDLGNPVRLLNTGEIFASQGRAAEMVGVSASSLSQHLNGKRDHIAGLVFERLPWNAE